MADYKSVITGCLDNLPTLNSRLVRIFISSTFTDTREERNLLLEEIYPRLKAYCKENHGLDFQLVDMRWGVPSEAADDHLATMLCLQEIRNCQRLSTGPNFVTFLNQKHGYRPLQVTIPESEFELLLGSLKDEGGNTSLLEKWYLKDENSEPAIYVLQPITLLIPEYKTKPEAREEWNSSYNQMRDDLKTASLSCYNKGQLSEEEKHKYFMSVTEDEIVNGVLNVSGNVEDHCLCFIRIIEDLSDNLNHNKAWRFIDMIKSDAVDEEAQQILSKLRDVKLTKRLKTFNISRNMVKWSEKDGINRLDHAAYLKSFGESFYNSTASLIQKAVKTEKSLSQDQLYIEVLQHATMAMKRCETFHGREEILTQVGEYLRGKHGYPLVLYGQSGCGKTSIMAQTAKIVRTVYHESAVVILRFLGTSPNSSNLWHLLHSMCEQIAVCYNKDRQEVPADIDTLKDFFIEELKLASADKPLVILLDSLDQLSQEHNAHRLNWIPRKLPANVRLIVSSYSEGSDLIATLKLMFLSQCFISIPVFSPSLSEQVLLSWLKKKQRTVTKEQLSLVETAFTQCTLPLYVKLIFDQVVLWKSYTSSSECVLAFTVQNSINQLFSMLEKKHGRVFVSRALAYVTASGTGISETELEDLLSLDDVVLTNVFQIHIPPFRRIPPLLWVRIRHDISEYLVDKEVDEVRVFFWYHRQFFETATQRYLADKNFKEEIHSLMADYYLGKWHNVKKSFKYTPEQMKKIGVASPDDEADRKVAAQPLIFSQSEEHTEKTKMRYNKRKLNKLPHHLFESGRKKELRSLCLMNHKWIQTKLDALSVQEVLLDYVLFHEKHTIIYKAINAARSTMKKFPSTLSMELSGRLLAIMSNKMVPEEYKLLEDALNETTRKTKVVPYQPCYSIPSESELYLIEYPKIPFDCKTVALSGDSQRLAILSSDNEMIFWDLTSGDMETTVPLASPNGEKLNVMCVNGEGNILIVGTTYQKQANPIFLVDINTATLEKQLLLEKNYFSVGFTDSLKFQMTESVLVAMSIGQAGDCFDIDNGKLLHEFDIKPDMMEVINKGQMVMFHARQSNTFFIYSLSTYEFINQISCNGTPKYLSVSNDFDIGCIALDGPASVQIVQTTADPDIIGRTVDIIDLQRYTSDKLQAAELKKDLCLVTAMEGFLVWNMKTKTLVSKCIIPDSVKPRRRRVLSFYGCLTSNTEHVVAGYESHLVIFQTKSGAVIHTEDVSRSLISRTLVSPCGQYIVTTTRLNNVVKGWKLDLMMSRYKEYQPLAMSNSARYLTVCNTGTTAVARSQTSDDFVVIDIITGSIRCAISQDYEAMTPSISWNGKFAVLREYDSLETLKVWDTGSGKLRTSVPISSLNLKGFVLGESTNRIGILTENDKTGDHSLTLAALPDVKVDITIPLPRYNMMQIFFVRNDEYVVASIEESKKGEVDIYVCIFSASSGDLLNTIDRCHPKSIQPITTESSCFACQRIYKGDDGKEAWEFVIIDVVTMKDVIVQRENFPTSTVSIGNIGHYGLDRQRWVYDLRVGKRCFQFDPDSNYHDINPGFRNSPKIMKDEKHAVWLHLSENLLKVGDVKTQEVICICPIHSEPMNLAVTESGVVLMGCEDGRIMMVQVVQEEIDSQGVVMQVLQRSKKKFLNARDSMVKTLTRKQTSGQKSGSSGQGSRSCDIL